MCRTRCDELAACDADGAPEPVVIDASAVIALATWRAAAASALAERLTDTSLHAGESVRPPG